MLDSASEIIFTESEEDNVHEIIVISSDEESTQFFSDTEESTQYYETEDERELSENEQDNREYYKIFLAEALVSMNRFRSDLMALRCHLSDMWNLSPYERHNLQGITIWLDATEEEVNRRHSDLVTMSIEDALFQ